MIKEQRQNKSDHIVGICMQVTHLDHIYNGLYLKDSGRKALLCKEAACADRVQFSLTGK